MGTNGKRQEYMGSKRQRNIPKQDSSTFLIYTNTSGNLPKSGDSNPILIKFPNCNRKLMQREDALTMGQRD